MALPNTMQSAQTHSVCHSKNNMKLQSKADNYGSTVTPISIYAKLKTRMQAACTQPQPFWARYLVKFIVNVVKNKNSPRKSCLLRQTDAQFSI